MKRIFAFLGVSLIGFLITLPTLWPLFRPEFFHMHDFTHVARLAEFNRGLQAGHIPVRWSENFGYGYGMPLFSFYAPLFYMIAEVFLLLGLASIPAIKISIGVLFVAGFVAMYYLGAFFWGRWGGLVSATAFTYLPYRAVDVYVRGALSELTGITMIPIVCVSLFYLVRKPSLTKASFAGLAIGLLLLSHNLITLMALPTLLVLFGGYLIATRRFSLKILFLLSLSFLLGIGLSAFYLFPAFLEKGYTNVDSLTQGFSHYSQHFLYLRQLWHSRWGYGGSIYGLEDDVSFEIGKIHLLLLPFSGLLPLLYLLRKSNWNRLIISRKQATGAALSLILIVGLILMSTFKTQAIWDAVPVLHFIQFPWRFLSVVVVLVSFLAGSVMVLLPSRRIKAMVVLILGILFVYLNKNFFQPKEYLENASLLYYEDATKIQTHMSGILPDFVPPGVPVDVTPPPARISIVHDKELIPVPLAISRPHAFLAQVRIQEPTTFRVHTFYFPGFKIFVNNTEVPFSVSPPPLPVMEFQITPTMLTQPDAAISVLLTETPLRQASNTVSFLALLSIGYIWIYKKRLRSNQTR